MNAEVEEARKFQQFFYGRLKELRAEELSEEIHTFSWISAIFETIFIFLSLSLVPVLVIFVSCTWPDQNMTL